MYSAIRFAYNCFEFAKKYFNLFLKAGQAIKAYTFCGLSIVAILFSFLFAGATFALRVDYDGKNIATVRSEQDFNAAVTLVTREVNGANVEAAVKQPVYTTALCLNKDINSKAEVAQAIIENTDDIVSATALKINGEVAACVTDVELDKLLDWQRTRFELEGLTCNSEFIDNVTAEDGYYLSSELTDPTSVNTVIENLQVKTTVETTTDCNIPFSTTTKENSQMQRGNSKIISAGQNGVSRITETITYVNGAETERVQSESIVITAPVAQVVEVGTAKSVVSASERSVARNTGFTFPLPKSGWVVSAYYGDGRNHQAIDLACDKGTPIYSVLGGTVVSAGWDGNYGLSILIDHGNGIMTRYAHECEIYVKAGDSVQAGEKIGAVGRTGNASGNHLHFEVLINNKRVDPTPYIALD